MNTKTPTHILQDTQPTCETSAEAVHKSPLGTIGTVLTQPSQQQQWQLQSQPSLNDQVTHAHRSVGGLNKSLENSGVSATVCSNCRTTTTPLWRRAPNGETICNACGLYLKARNTVRPPWLKRNTIKKVPAAPSHEPTSGSCPGDGLCNGAGGASSCDGCPAFNQHQVNRQSLMCANCRTVTTPLWRRDEAGNTICNACGLYYKLHNVHRPVTMKRSVIKRRKRVALASSPQPHHHHHIAPSPSTEDSDLSDHAPGLSRESSSSGTEEEDSARVSRKRKAASTDEPVCNIKRIDTGSRSISAIEDYSLSKCGGKDVVMDHQQHQHPQAARDLEERRRSLTPVEPATFHSETPSVPQVQIHGVGPIFRGGAPYQRPISPITSEPSAHVTTGVSVPSLLNPTFSSTVQFPSISLPHVSTITHYPQASHASDLSAASHTQQVLTAHRQELQREVNHLSVLLSRTAAMLNNLDNAMAATGQPGQSLSGSQPTTALSIFGSDPLASIMALSSAAASSAYASPAVASSSTMNLPPIHAHHFPTSGSCTPQQLPSPGNSPTILPAPIPSHYSRA